MQTKLLYKIVKDNEIMLSGGNQQWRTDAEFVRRAVKRVVKNYPLHIRKKQKQRSFMSSSKKNNQITKLQNDFDDQSHENDLLQYSLDAAWSALTESERVAADLKNDLESSEHAATSLAF